MSDRWRERLSEYLDDELSPAERSEFEVHLDGCLECARTLAELRQVVSRAQALEDRPPAQDLWAGIAERIGVSAGEAPVVDLEEIRGSRSRSLGRQRFSFSLPQLVAASIALIILSGGSAWVLSRAAGPEVGVATTQSLPGPAEAGGAFVASNYDAAVAELERVLEASRDNLDPETVRVIEENLRIINRAIAQAQRALAQDPGSEYLNDHLASTMRQKWEFLQQAAQMTGAVS